MNNVSKMQSLKTKKIKSIANDKPIKRTITQEGKNRTSLDDFSKALSDALNEKYGSSLQKEENEQSSEINEVPEVSTEVYSSRKDSSLGGDSGGENETTGETTVQFPSQLEEDETASKNSSSMPKNTDELASEIEKIMEYYNSKSDEDLIPEEYLPSVPGSLGLSQVDVPVLDKDALLDEVTKEETYKTNQEKKSTEDKINNEIESILAEIENKNENSSSTKEEINKIYDDYKLAEENEAIKRGLARSSTILLTLDGVEASRAEALSSAAISLEKEISKLESEITKLKNELTEALSSLDLELSQNINAELKNRIEEIEKKQKEAIEFNNNVKKLEAEYAAKKNSYVTDSIELENLLKEQYEGAAVRFKEEDILDLAMKYFSSKDKQTALKELTSSTTLIQTMGDLYYDLYYLLMRRDY